MKSKTLKNLTYVLIVVCLTVTFLQGYFPVFRKIWLIDTVAAFFSLIIARGFLRSKSLPFLVLYILFIFANSILGDSYFGKIGNVLIETCCLLLVFSMYWELKKEGNNSTRSLVFFTFCICLIITAIGSYISDVMSPGVMRHAFGVSSQGDGQDLLYQFYRMGMSDYMLPHAVPIIIPGIVFGLKIRTQLPRIVEFILWITIVSLLSLSYLSGSTTALILSIISLIISASLKPGDFYSNIVRVVVLLIIASPILFSDTVQITILDGLDRLVSDASYFHRKIDLFKDSLLYEDTQVMATREKLYELSFKGLLEHPIFGTNSEIGGHSSFLDRFASLGVVGIIPFVLFVVIQYKTTNDDLDKNDTPFYLVGFFMGISMCCLKSAWNWYTLFSMFVFLPITILYFRQTTMRQKQ